MGDPGDFVPAQHTHNCALRGNEPRSIMASDTAIHGSSAHTLTYTGTTLAPNHSADICSKTDLRGGRLAKQTVSLSLHALFDPASVDNFNRREVAALRHNDD